MDHSEIHTIPDMKNTLEGINSRLDTAEGWISNLEDKVEKNPPNQSGKKKKELKTIKII